MCAGVLGRVTSRGRCASPTACAGWDAQGVGSFLELGPDGVLSAMAQECLAGDGEDGDGQGEAEGKGAGAGDGASGVAAVAAAAREAARSGAARRPGGRWVRGVEVDWARVRARVGARLWRCPRTPSSASATGSGGAARRATGGRGRPGGGGAPAARGRGRAGGRGGLAVHGRLSLDTQPWLADHAVMGTVLLPGTAFVELALHAGGRLGVLASRSWSCRRRWCWRDRGRAACRSRSASRTRAAGGKWASGLAAAGRLCRGRGGG